MRTWKLKIYVKETEAKMIQAMHKRTQIGCDALIEDAIATCPVSTVAKYIKTYYSKNTKKWALWARQYSPLLLQVTSTNALESYHSELKRLTRVTFGIVGKSFIFFFIFFYFFLFFYSNLFYTGACQRTVELDLKKRADCQRAAYNRYLKHVSIPYLDKEMLSMVKEFPYPFQLLLAKEVEGMMSSIQKGKPLSGLEQPECNCNFFSHYLLPCKHIFHQHLYGPEPGKLLTTNVWMAFQQMFVESGVQLYVGRERVVIPIAEPTVEQRQAEARRLQVNELMERVRDKYWSVEDKGDAEATTDYITRLTHSLSSIL
jgi:hypothetical protein